MRSIKKAANVNPARNIPELIRMLFPKPNLSIRSLRESFETKIKNAPKNNPNKVASIYCCVDNHLIVIAFSKLGSNPEIFK
jgi:hypothetical protein